MGWWGTMIGGTVGFFFGGPLGALLGATVGHGFDSSSTMIKGGGYFGIIDNERVQTAFFTALFSVMGCLATADGRVSEEEAEAVQKIMAHMRLSPDQQRVAVRLFNQGKQPGFPLDNVLEQFRRECHGRRDLLRIYLEILLTTAMSDGEIETAEYHVLTRASDALHFPRADFEHIVRVMEARHYEGAEFMKKRTLKDAYGILGISEEATGDEIKKAYRNLMNQYHPDKLVSKGLPEEMIRFATEKTQEIKAAYEIILEFRTGR